MNKKRSESGGTLTLKQMERLYEEASKYADDPTFVYVSAKSDYWKKLPWFEKVRIRIMNFLHITPKVKI